MTETAQHTATEQWNDRTIRLLGDEATERLKKTRVVIVGTGGVGGYAAEMLTRSGVGFITIIDADNVSLTNINRQLIADHSCLGQPKVALFAKRFAAINPDAVIQTHHCFLSEENIPQLIPHDTDFVVDAIDTVAPKVALITHCLRHKIKIISSMGAGGRVDPGAISYCDIRQTRQDGLARAVRQRLKTAGINRSLPVVASTEAPRRHSVIAVEETNKRSSYGTIATIPAIFGIYLANYVIRKLTGI